MATRIQLQSKLEELLGSRNVYYQPPESMRMQYPAIRYSKKKASTKYANDAVYSLINCYELIVIDQKPDNNVIRKLINFPYCTYERSYVSNGLNHDVFTLYF